MKIFLRALIVTIFIVTIGWWAVRAVQSGAFTGSTATQLLLYGRLAGLLMALCFFVLLLSMGKSRSLDIAFSKAAIVKNHRFLGLWVIFPLLVIHGGLVLYGRSVLYDESFSSVVRQFFTSIPWGLMTCVGLLVLLAILTFCHMFNAKKINFPTWHKTHSWVYLAILLLFFHQIFFGNDFVASRPFFYFWIICNAIIWLDVIIWKILQIAKK